MAHYRSARFAALRRLRPYCAALSAWALLAGCQRENAELDLAPPAAKPGAPPQAQTRDRLPPGTLIEGTEQVFGFRLPKLLRVEARFPDGVDAQGPVTLAALEDYVSARVRSHHVEVTPAQSHYPRVLIRGGDPQRQYDITLIPKQKGEVRLLLRDVTPAPTVQGVTIEQRWERAGLTPSGHLARPHEME